MKNFQKKFPLFLGVVLGILAVMLVCLPRSTNAQTVGILPVGSTPITQTATRADAATTCQTSASSAATLTFSAQPGLTFYLTELDFQNVVNGTAVTAAAPTTLSTTNLPGTPSWTLASGVTAGTNTQSLSVSYPTALKASVQSTATTVVLPTFATNQTVRVNACGFYA